MGIEKPYVLAGHRAALAKISVCCRCIRMSAAIRALRNVTASAARQADGRAENGLATTRQVLRRARGTLSG
jgi:hypothetical protein